eukprot:TRINITY_DN6325_c0_g1_i1.p1 TRINITY_DN6325_c0_g1~~TRINITY_DN6325_c0_g1_i1.p1  ORF type:complete len:289 (+),score=69.03 TRINITY_DN6325_c0_g1_i1:55-921(+)
MATFGRCERSPPKVVVVTQDAMQGGKAAVPRNTLEHETKQILYPELGKEKLATQPEYWRPFQSALLKSPVGAHRLRRLPDDQELDRRRWFQDQAARAFHEAKDGATKAAASQRGALAENLAQAGRAALSATTPRSTQRSSADGPGLTPRSEKQRTTSTLRTEERPVTADLDTAVALILGQSELSSTSALRLARAYTYWDARSAAEKQSKHARPGGDNRIIPLSGAQAQAALLDAKLGAQMREQEAAKPYSEEAKQNLLSARHARRELQSKSRGVELGKVFNPERIEKS